jgi:predicted PurR-regulated permease PerM
MKRSSRRAVKVDLHISFLTLAKVMAFVFLIAILIKLIPLLSLCLLALLLAIAMEPVLEKLQRWMPRGVAITLLLALIVFTVVEFTVTIFPTLYAQALLIIQKLPGLKSSLLKYLPNIHYLRTVVDRMASLPAPNFEAWSTYLVNFGASAVEVVSSTVLLVVIMVYLLVDGRRTEIWFFAFFRPSTKAKLQQTLKEIEPVISSYFLGQAITSVLCSVFVYIMLTALSVPAATVLAVVAGVFDILPVIGFFLSVIPAILFALTVSPEAAFIVLALYGIYHALENYLIVPWVYGNRLRLSGLVVLISILVGISLAGILGAVVILPMAASYSIVERIWFRSYVGKEVVAEHQELDSNKD